MSIILKYKLNLLETTALSIPAGSMFLSLQLKNGSAVMWRLVDGSQNKPLEEIQIDCFMTGKGGITTDYAGIYRGTVQADSGLVLHFFERREKLYLQNSPRI